VSHASDQYAERVKQYFHDAGFYAEVDLSDLTFNRKIRNAEISQANFIFVVGQQEEEKEMVNARKASKEGKDVLVSLEAALLLMNQLKELTKNPVDGFSVGLQEDDLYRWNVMIEGPPGTDYEGGFFPCSLEFPKEYPDRPPVMRFLTAGFWHPNVYKDGKVCISILHEAKEDALNPQEALAEKWRPILGVEAVLLSVISMLNDPNLDSPANVDAAVQYKKDRRSYSKRIKDLVRKSQDAL